MKLSETQKEKLKKAIPWVLLILLLAFLIVGGKKYIQSNDRYQRKLDSIEKVQLLKEREYERAIEEKEQYIADLDKKEKTYYDEYINERNRRYAAEKRLAAIGNLVFDKRYLDSLADNVTY